MPASRRLDAHLIAADMDHGAVARHERSRRRDIDRAVGAADLIEHQLAVVIELDGEPVPSLLTLAEMGAAEFVIHPGNAAATLSVDTAGDVEARHRVVMRRVTDALRFDADAVLAVNRRRFA